MSTLTTPKPLQRLPLFLDLSACRVLLVGGGRTAEAKLGPLRDAGARILSVSLRHHDGFLREAERRGGVDLLRQPFHPSHLDGVRLAVSATDDPAVNSQVVREARRRDIFCNSVDDPEYCDAYFASIFRRGPWHLAIGTQGAFPGLSAALRGLLDQLIPEDHGATLEELACIRRRLKAELPDADLRRRRLERLLAAFRRTYFPTQEKP